MYFFFTGLFLPMINAIAIVKIHRSAIYHPVSSCTFLGNTSLPTEASIQSCVWTCVHENNCQTAVYFSDIKICSMFAETCQSDGIQSSENARASVISSPKNQEPSITCSPTVTTVSAMMTSTQQTTTDATTATTTTSTTTITPMNPCILGNYRWNTTGITVLNSTYIMHASGLFFDSNDTLYIVDEYNNYVVWKLPKNVTAPILIAGQVQSLGPNSTQLNFPQDVYLDSNQNLYVTDYYNYRVQKYINGSSIGITIAGNGSASTALNQFGGLRYFVFDPTETYMYVTDCDNHRIMRYPTNSTMGDNGTVVAGGHGNGSASTQLNYPWGIHYLPSVSSDLYITNYMGHSVMQWAPGNSSGVFVAGTPGVSGSNATLLNRPMGIKIDTYLNMFVVDNGNSRVQMFCYNNQTGITIAGDGTTGSNATQLSDPRGIAFDSSMNMYISDPGNVRIQKFLKL